MFKNLIKPVYAHCDVPCGIYETDTMKHSADTCLRMIEKIEALGEIDNQEKHNNFIRMVENKEIHAQKVKNELSLLWSDYFKPEHIERFPDLHNTFWVAAKQASKVKQTVSREECEKLVAEIAKVSDIFAQSKS